MHHLKEHLIVLPPLVRLILEKTWKFNIPTLIIHGDSDATVPYEYSGKLTHEAIPNSKVTLIKGGPHGLNATHAKEFNEALLLFLKD